MTLTVTATLATDRILVSAVSAPAVTDRVKVWRIHDDGSRYRVLTSADLMVGTWDGYDDHAPFNAAVTYQVESTTETSATSSAVFLPSDVPWLIHPSDRALSIPLDLMSVTEPFKFPSTAKLYPVLNSRLPVSRSFAPRGGEQGTLRIRVQADDMDALQALFADGGPLLLNGPWGKHDYGWKWILPGDLPIMNPGGYTGFPQRWVEVSYQECAAPDVDMAASWTIADLAAAYATVTAAAAGYTTIRNMALDVRV